MAIMRKIILFSICFCCEVVCSQQRSPSDAFNHPFYVGVMGGYGSTTWEGLVPSLKNQNLAMSISTPISVNEGGGAWGAFTGYEFSRFFAMEANYMRFPDATIRFDADSLFAFEQKGLTELHTQTQTASILAKIMLVLPKTSMRLYSGAGIASIWRTDEIYQDYRISPEFAFGATINFNERVMGEIGANYTAGYGESEINPAEDFIPFLYSVVVKLAVRF